MFEQTDDEVEQLMAERRTMEARAQRPDPLSDRETLRHVVLTTVLVAVVVFGVYFGGAWLLARWFEP